MKSPAPRATVDKADAPAADQGVALVDNRAVAVVQRQMQMAIDNSPRQVAQRQQAGAAAPPRNTTGLPDTLKAGVENLSGYSLDDVTVHYNSAKPAQLQAHAYAQGTDIHVAPGQEQHLPHEAWHVVQQKQGRVKSTLQMKGGTNLNDDAGLENEADVMGGRASLHTNPQQNGVALTLQVQPANVIQQVASRTFSEKDTARVQYNALVQNEKSSRINKELITQKRAIKGKITTEKVDGKWQIKPLGISMPPNLSINPTPNVALPGGANKAVLLGVDDLMRGHLVKAAWEGKNEIEQMTQWRQASEEVEWTNIEESAQEIAKTNASTYKGKETMLVHNVETEVDEPAIGNRLLGTDKSKIPVKWLKELAMNSNGADNIVNNIRTELNRMVTTAKMKVSGDTAGEITSQAHQGIEVKG